MSAIINIKNQAFSLPVIEVKGFDINEIIGELKRRVTVNEDGHQMLPCVLSVKSRELEPTFLAQIVEVLRQFDLQAVGLQTEDEAIAEHATYAGLAVFNERLNQYDLFQPQTELNFESSTESIESQQNEPQQKIHDGHVQAGEQVYAEGCDLVVLGDVLPGAEVIADGNVYIGGNLQGKAYAGNSGLMNLDGVYVRAYCFEPELISISGFYQLLEDIPKKYHGLSVKVKFEQQRMQYHLE